MGFSPIHYFVSLAAFVTYFYILYIGRRGGLLRHFPFFYAFVTWCLIRDALRWVVIFTWGYDSAVYYHGYYILGLFTPLAQILLLVEIYYQVKSRRDVGHWVVLAVFTGMMSWYSLHQQGSNPYIVFQTVVLHFQVLFCLLVHLQLQKNRQLYLGRNYSGILYGLSLMIALQSFNYALRLFEYLTPESFILYLQALALIPWIGYAFCMRTVDLPRRLQKELVDELAAAGTNLRRAVRVVQ